MARDGIDSSTFKQIFRDHWPQFKAVYPRFDTPHYDVAVQKMLDCGDPEKMGFVQYRCMSCGQTRRIAFSCKSAFCLSCARVYTDQWSNFIGRRLFPGATYRHTVLRVPKILTAPVPEILAAFRNGGNREPLFGRLFCNRLSCLGLSHVSHPWR